MVYSSWGGRGGSIAAGTSCSRASVVVDVVAGRRVLGGAFIADISDVTILISSEADDLDTGVGKKDTVFPGGDAPIGLLGVRVVVPEFRGLDGPVEVVRHAGSVSLCWGKLLGSGLEVPGIP